MPTYEDVHAGDVVLGYDSQLWGVKQVERAPQLGVTLTRHGTTVTAWPPPGTPVTIVERADVSAEALAAQAFIDAGIPVDLISESWEV